MLWVENGDLSDRHGELNERHGVLKFKIIRAESPWDKTPQFSILLTSGVLSHIDCISDSLRIREPALNMMITVLPKPPKPKPKPKPNPNPNLNLNQTQT